MAALPKAPSKYDPYKFYEVAKFRRDLVLENLEDNKYIDKKQLKEFKNTPIVLKRRKIEIVNEANSYTEEVRRSIKNKYGFKKLYSEGLSIRTPLDIDYQTKAIQALRKGIESYDRRHGWRGSISNKYKDPNWKKKIEKIKIDPTLNWKVAEIISLDENGFNFKTITGTQGRISNSKIKWALPKNTAIK